MAKEALTKIQAVIIAVVVIIAVILGAFAYTMMTPPATPTPATPTPATPTPATPTPATPTPATPTPATPSISEIRIGTVQHLSGALSPFIDGFRGIVMGVNWINAHGGINFNGQKVPLKLVFYDDETNKDYAIKLYEKLIAEDKVHILIPPWTPEYILATVPVSERYKMVAIGCGGGSFTETQQGFKYYLSYAAGALYHFTNQLKLIKQLDPAAKKVALIVSSADPSGDLGKGARAAANEYGFNIIYDKVYPEDMADATPMLREIAALNPDILLGATFPKSCMLIASQLRDLRIYIKWVTLDMQVTKVDFANAFGKWAVGFSQAVPSEHEVLWEKIAEREGKEYYGIRCAELQTYWVAAGGTGRIRATAIMGAAGVSLAAKLIEGSKSFDADRLIGYATTVDIYTCRGPYRCNPNNPAECLTDQQHAVMQWQRDGSYLVYKVVYPVEFATGIFIPMPTWEEKETWPELTLKW